MAEPDRGLDKPRVKVPISVTKGEPFEVTVTHHPAHRFTFNMELRSVSRSFNP